MQPSGRPSFCTSGFAGDGVSSCLESRTLRRCRLTNTQVAPNLGPSVSPTIRSSGCPDSRIFRLRLIVARVAPGIAPSGVPAASFPGLPGPSASGCVSELNFRVAPALHLSGGADLSISKSPRTSIPSALPISRFAGFPAHRAFRHAVYASASFPASASTAGSMMNPCLVSNLASSTCAADESSRPTKSNGLRPTLRALSILSAFSTSGCPAMADCKRPILRFLPGWSRCPTCYRVTN